VAGVTGQSVVVHRFVTDPKTGDRSEVSQHVVGRCAFAPRTSAGSRGGAELTDRASTVVADAELFAPYSADVVPTDVIELDDGTLWEVAGPVERWRSPFAAGWSPGAVIPLRRMTG
jgi:hypothetical protein